MRGTTVCPHCGTRFKVSKTQLEAHHGMVRCGNCMKPFDTRPNYAPDQLDLQLDLPVLDAPKPPPQQVATLKPMTLAEQVRIVPDAVESNRRYRIRTWPWVISALLMLLLLVAQGIYFFRVDLSARVPILKPVLNDYCRMLGCNIPLPAHSDLVGIESSDLEAVPTHNDQVILNALLRNRAAFTQAFPNLELTLNDAEDKPIARRVFVPSEYLPPVEKESTGLLPNYEINIKLYLGTGTLKPLGYRLVLFYPTH